MTIAPHPQDHLSFLFGVYVYMCVYFIAAILVVDGSLWIIFWRRGVAHCGFDLHFLSD